MKAQLTVLTFFLFSITVFGQLQVDAGNDTIFCRSDVTNDTIFIGGNPSAIGGAAPYTYSWTASYSIGSNTYGASNFLDDTTKANPIVIDVPAEGLYFTLNVTDANGAQEQDSVFLGVSQYFYHLGECISFIEEGDTTSLQGNMAGGMGPLSYSWSPNYNISDTTAGNPMAWPNTTTTYEVFAIDSIGCISEVSSCSVTVWPLGVNAVNAGELTSKVYPNPLNENSIISLEKKFKYPLSIQVFNAIGQVIVTDELVSNSYAIGKEITNPGLYVYLIKSESEILSKGQFVKN